MCADPAPVDVDRETLTVLGWNKDCSVAISHLSYPVVGSAISDEPVITKLGTLTIAPGKEKAAADWRIQWEGRRSWQPAEYAESKAELAKQGYTNKGWHEVVRAAPVAPDRDVPRLILTTDTFRTAAAGFPKAFPSRWRMSHVYYSPLDAACALLIFEDKKAVAAHAAYEYRLIRVGNPGIRADRALAHLTNGLLLLERGDRAGALEETQIAVQMAPDDASSRYQYARQLALNGKGDAAMDELAAAVKLEKSYKRKARGEPDFEDLSWIPRFKEITK